MIPDFIYVAGPMRGIPEFNFPLFNAVAYCLREDGSVVFNPAERDIERHGGVDISKGNLTGSLEQASTEHKFSLREALAEDLDFICRYASKVVMLPGWEGSAGAMAEHRTAVALKSEGVEVLYLHQGVCDLMIRAYELAQPKKEAAE